LYGIFVTGYIVITDHAQLLFFMQDHYCPVYDYYVVGSRALIANESIETEPNAAVGEWMSSVLKPYASDSSVACLILDLKLEEFIKRINVELLYQDVNDTIQKTSLFELDVQTDEYFEYFIKERFTMFEFHLHYVLQYQVNADMYFLLLKLKSDLFPAFVAD